MSDERAEPARAGCRVGGRVRGLGWGGPHMTSIDAGVSTELNLAIDAAFSLNCWKETCRCEATWLAIGPCGCDVLLCDAHRSENVARLERIHHFGGKVVCQFCKANPLKPVLRWVPVR